MALCPVLYSRDGPERDGGGGRWQAGAGGEVRRGAGGGESARTVFVTN